MVYATFRPQPDGELAKPRCIPRVAARVVHELRGTAPDAFNPFTWGLEHTTHGARQQAADHGWRRNAHTRA